MPGQVLPNREYTNGFGGNVTWTPDNGAPFSFPVASWEFTDNNALIDVTNTSSGLWLEFIGGPNEGSMSLKVYWDSNNLYTGAAASLIPGTRGEVVLEIGETTDVITCPEVVIQSAKMMLSPKTATTFDLEMKLTAPPDLPA